MYKGCPKINGTPPFTLNGLLYKYYTSSKPILIFFFWESSLFLNYFKKRVKWETFFLHISLYLVTNHWKEGLLIRKLIKLTKGFYDIPCQNGGPSKFTSCL